VAVRTLPGLSDLATGKVSLSDVRELDIDDLLGREPVKPNGLLLNRNTHSKTVLVTGAGGSIGGELCRQILKFKPSHLVCLDISEHAIYQLEKELSSQKLSTEIIYIVGDVKNEARLNKIFSTYRPKVVFHAAAYKHVPLMEDNPAEAVATNVFGSANVLEIAAEFGAERFVMVSTDKAVNPTNVMGASKRIAEMVVQSKETSLICVTTRFGNVLGSNGSVIPVFRKQIEEGGPVTVTHRDITRFFMTIPEAVQLVLEAGAMGKGNDIFAFDMGQQVRISDLAEQMIRLSGLEPGQDIEIQYTGLRPGEKLYEEVLATEENTVPTHHEKILSAKVREVEASELNEKLTRLKEQMNLQNNKEMVRVMKEIVPEFKSNNSEFSLLDN